MPSPPSNKYLLALFIVAVYFLGRIVIRSLVNRVGSHKNFVQSRVAHVGAALTYLWSLIAIVALIALFAVESENVAVFLGSVAAFLGVALFAQWSILSNLTSSIIIFFFFPYRVGDHICIYEKDFSVEGTIEEIALFHIILGDPKGLKHSIPNALFFQKAVRIGGDNPPADNAG